MAATRQDLRRWFEQGVNSNHQFMIVVCDTFDWEDYPVYCNPVDFAEHYKQSTSNMQKVMEVYDLSLDPDQQLNSKSKVFNYPKDFKA